ncbi:MAG: hypothetical protein ACI4DY_01885 [Monoglobaceae bacterium]
MREFYDCEYEEKCCGGRKFVTALALAGMAAATAFAVVTHMQNKKYKEKIIELSNSIPNTPEQEAELEEIRKREWAAANAPANRKTDEERLEENRINEEA